nr:protein-glutamate O-methyltransferase CheR [Cerasicoccus arenae]
MPARITRDLREQFGLDEGVFRGSSLNSVIRRRMEETGQFELDDYFDLLQQSRQEFIAFADELLVPESWFFRDGKPFIWLTEWLRTVWRKNHQGEKLRILSLPCATGQEPYSIAMTLLHEGFSPESFHVEAGDLSERFIKDAQRGEYRKIAFRSEMAESYASYFEDAGNDLRRVRDHVRKQVTFRQLNLLSPTFLQHEPPFHVIFCRNVLIYFSSCSRERAVAGLMNALAPDGVLFAGHADSLPSITSTVKAVGPTGAFCFERRPVEPEVSQSSLVNRVIRSTPPPRQPKPTRHPPPLESAKLSSADQWNKVRAFANSGRLEEAEKLCQEMMKQSPPTADAFCTLGEIYSAQRRHREAEPLFRRAVYLEARHAQSLFHLALLSERRGDQAGAERLRKRAQAAEKASEVKA